MALETSNKIANPYAAPKAQVDDAATVTGAEPAFFPVSLLKLALMSLATFGLYEIYWSYRNWKCVQRMPYMTYEKPNAPIRAFFYPLTSYWLFLHIREQSRVLDGTGTLQAGLLALTVLAFRLLARRPDPYWLLCLLGFLPLLPVQSVVNRINRRIAPDADPNARFGGWNILLLVVAASLLALGLML